MSKKIMIVGVCASGKTTLENNLKALGYDAHSCAQEHSGVHDLWRHSGAEVLIYLSATLPVVRARRGDDTWTRAELAAQRKRLAHARAHANLSISTDGLTPEQVLDRAVKFLSGLTHPEFRSVA